MSRYPVADYRILCVLRKVGLDLLAIVGLPVAAEHRPQNEKGGGVMIGYKLTDKNDRTYVACQWGPGVTHEASGKGKLCNQGWIHLYDDPLLAVLHNPIHGRFGLSRAHLWECDVFGKIKRDGQMKFGAARVTTLRRIDLPMVTTEQQVRYGILVAMEVYREARWLTWAQNWLSGKDRSAKTAKATARSAAEAVAQASADAAAGKELDLVAIARKAVES